jgi:hypothetical protein
MKFLSTILLCLKLAIVQSTTQDGTFIINNVITSSDGEVVKVGLESLYSEDKSEESLNLIINKVTLGDPEFTIRTDSDYRYITLQLNLVIYYNSTAIPDPTDLFKVDLFSNGGLVDSLNTTQLGYDEIADVYAMYPTSINRRNYFGTKVYKLDTRVDTQSYIVIEHKIDPSFRVYFKEVRIYASFCHPSCSNCDAGNRTCLSCASGKADDDKCGCGEGEYKSYSTNMNFTCNKKTSLEMCDSVSDNVESQDYCLQCTNTTLHKISLTSGDYSNCICPPNHIKRTNQCISVIDKSCQGYDGFKENTTLVQSFVNNFDNFALVVISNLDEVFGSSFIKVNLLVQNYPDYSTDPVVFKLELKEKNGTANHPLFNLRNDKTYIYNAPFPSEQINFKGGIDINIEDAGKDIYDCENESDLIFKCNIWVSAYHPCTKTIYFEKMVPISFSNQGAIQSRYNLDTNKTDSTVTDIPYQIPTDHGSLTPPKVDIPCIKQGACYYNYDYATALTICANEKCERNRTLSYAPNDIINLRTKVTSQSHFGSVYSHSLNTAAFIIRKPDGNETTRTYVLDLIYNNYIDDTLQLGLSIPDASSLMTSDDYVVGNTLNLALFLRVSTNITDSYILAPAILVDINMNIEYLFGGERYSIKTDNTPIVAMSIIVVMLVITMVILFYFMMRVRRKFYSLSKEARKVTIERTPNRETDMNFRGNTVQTTPEIN